MSRAVGRGTPTADLRHPTPVLPPQKYREYPISIGAALVLVRSRATPRHVGSPIDRGQIAHRGHDGPSRAQTPCVAPANPPLSR